MVSSTIDSSSYFHDLAQGQNAYISGFTTLLAVAEAFGKVNFH